jgi:hypothetical protein
MHITHMMYRRFIQTMYNLAVTYRVDSSEVPEIKGLSYRVKFRIYKYLGIMSQKHLIISVVGVKTGPDSDWIQYMCTDI